MGNPLFLSISIYFYLFLSISMVMFNSYAQLPEGKYGG